MAESFRAVDISNVGKGNNGVLGEKKNKRSKWIGRQNSRKANPSKELEKEVEFGKHNLVDVMILDGFVDDCGKGEKKISGK